MRLFLKTNESSTYFKFLNASFVGFMLYFMKNFIIYGASRARIIDMQ